jgi:hypothetical protein
MRKAGTGLIMIPGGMTSQLRMLRHGHQQAFQGPSLALTGEPCPHSKWKTEEALRNYVGGMDPECLGEDFQ